jgi:hypothetical protein
MAEVVALKAKPEQPEKFEIGSTVRLKSGGAIMTVRKPGKANVIVDWTNCSDDICSAEFPNAMLAFADADEEEAGEPK